MSNPYFQFKRFVIQQDRCAMKVTTDACLFGAWISHGPPREEEFNVLDIGTGSGLLALQFAQKNTSAMIDAVEIDRTSFEQARENITASPWADRIKIFNGDAREFDFGRPYDMIISNPPFYENEILSADKKRNLALHHEGLLLEELMLIIQKNLKPDGSFFLLLPYKRNAAIRDLLLKHEFVVLQMTFVRPSVSQDYFRIMLKGRLETDAPIETVIGEIAIRDEHGKYTAGFTALLKDYYLYL